MQFRVALLALSSDVHAVVYPRSLPANVLASVICFVILISAARSLRVLSCTFGQVLDEAWIVQVGTWVNGNLSAPPQTLEESQEIVEKIIENVRAVLYGAALHGSFLFTPTNMPRLAQYDYIFGLGVVFCALDAYNIGANDVANSFATSVASKSLTLKQACMAAALCEFLGAVLVGARVAGTIKNGIISLSVFNNDPGVQMLSFFCALAVSASWLMLCTRLGWPVSTTYSIVSALIGAGVALGGTDSVQWGWNGGRGVATIFAGFGIAPSLAAGFAAVVFLITKYAVLVRKDPTKWALLLSPLYFFTVTAVLTMSIVYKGAPSLNLDKLSEMTVALAITMTALVVSVLSMLFWLPFVYKKAVKHDYTIRWYHFFFGPLLWKRATPEDAEDIAQGRKAVPNYGLYDEDHVPAAATADDIEKAPEFQKNPQSSASSDSETPVPLESNLKSLERPQIEGPIILPRNMWIALRYIAIPKVWGILSHGTSVDIHDLQKGDKSTNRMKDMHDRATQYPNETEHVYSFLQVLTACTASFAHGSNDVSNAIGPFAAIYQAWSSGVFVGSRSNIPVWILVFGASMIVIGLATYGYNIMRVLGNRLTMMSPSRGFSMELGASITVLLASQYGIPVSSTMCIVGATLGVALCNGDLRAFNWKGLAWIVMGWVLTVPVVATLSGCFLGFIINAPRFGSA